MDILFMIQTHMGNLTKVKSYIHCIIKYNWVKHAHANAIYMLFNKLVLQTLISICSSISLFLMVVYSFSNL